jgi:hypothetical protein
MIIVRPALTVPASTEGPPGRARTGLLSSKIVAVSPSMTMRNVLRPSPFVKGSLSLTPQDLLAQLRARPPV